MVRHETGPVERLKGEVAVTVIAFILAVVAAVIFAVEALRPRPVNLLALGLCVLTVAWIVTLVVRSGSTITLGS
jgi:hypothetical protein